MSSEPILICFDGSQSAEHSFQCGRSIAGRPQGDRRRHRAGVDGRRELRRSHTRNQHRLLEQENLAGALQRAEQGAELARRAGFDAEARAELSAPTWEGIVDLANEVDAAVIVIGSRGLKGVRERLEGSVSHQVAEHSRRPVLIVTPPDEHR